MRLLILFADRFRYQPAQKVWEGSAEDVQGGELDHTLVALVDVETHDPPRADSVAAKLARNLKWAAGKNTTKVVVIHSFAHLSTHHAPPALAGAVLDRAAERLERAGYRVRQTPFGHLLDLEMAIPGRPWARVFKEL